MTKRLEVGEVAEKTLLMQHDRWIDDEFHPSVIVKAKFVWTGYKMIEVKPWQTPEQVSKMASDWYEDYHNRLVKSRSTRTVKNLIRS